MVNYWGAQTEIKTKNSIFYMYLGHSQQVTVFSVDVCFDSHTVTKGPHVVALSVCGTMVAALCSDPDVLLWKLNWENPFYQMK